LPEGRGWSVIVMRPEGDSYWAIDFYGGKASRLSLADDSLIETKELGLPKSLAGIAEYRSR
jgi:hypothetical protein